MSRLNEYGKIQKLALRHARQAFGSQERIEAQWRELNYHSEPDYVRAIAEYDQFLDFFHQMGTEIHLLAMDECLTIDAIYTRDSSIVSPKGMILCKMGKPARMTEPAYAAKTYEQIGVPIAGAITGEGRLEGGDFLWLDDQTCVVGQGYRTNAEGIRQLRELLGSEIELQVMPLPHFKGPGDVFHLMSILSPLDKDLLLVYSPLMTVPFRNWLLDRGYQFVEVPEAEFESMACNVLALAPRQVLVVDNNPETRRRLEAAGCDVRVYRGREISRKGEGGPTCLTRPLVRE